MKNVILALAVMVFFAGTAVAEAGQSFRNAVLSTPEICVSSMGGSDAVCSSPVLVTLDDGSFKIVGGEMPPFKSILAEAGKCVVVNLDGRWGCFTYSGELYKEQFAGVEAFELDGYYHSQNGLTPLPGFIDEEEDAEESEEEVGKKASCLYSFSHRCFPW